MLKYKGKNLDADDEQLSLFDFAQTHENITFLDQIGLMAERHWREFLPGMLARLEAEGRLMEALWEAQETTLEEMETLTRRMEKAQAMAWELVREKYILLPPESSND